EVAHYVLVTDKSGGQSPGDGGLSWKSLLWFAERMEIDSKLLALLIKVAALEAKSSRDVGHVKVVAANFGQQQFPFKSLGARGEAAGAGRCGGWGRCARGLWEHQAHVLGGNGIVRRKKHQPFDHVAKFADIAGPGILTQLADSLLEEDLFFPAVLRCHL